MVGEEKYLSKGRSAPWTATSSLPAPKRTFQHSLPFPQTVLQKELSPDTKRCLGRDSPLTPNTTTSSSQHEPAQPGSLKAPPSSTGKPNASSPWTLPTAQPLPVPPAVAARSRAPAWPLQCLTTPSSSKALKLLPPEPPISLALPRVLAVLRDPVPVSVLNLPKGLASTWVCSLLGHLQALWFRSRFGALPYILSWTITRSGHGSESSWQSRLRRNPSTSTGQGAPSRPCHPSVSVPPPAK